MRVLHGRGRLAAAPAAVVVAVVLGYCGWALLAPLAVALAALLARPLETAIRSRGRGRVAAGPPQAYPAAERTRGHAVTDQPPAQAVDLTHGNASGCQAVSQSAAFQPTGAVLVFDSSR